ncbi:Protein of unknown function DUF723 [uncultured Caudovirales phage]|uniref:Uncharacterized protein n=1 Tax=uncultured Caudovirales phage TaxID=2100421 RepID=A0A6J5KQ88_9CAUD|nr:Protein of unknown function DUF723 [uncultured Caudovirales phage]
MAKPSLSIDQFISKATEQHHGLYSYTIITPIVKAHQTIRIQCPEHGEFLQKAFHHLHGAGCKKCGIAARSGFNSSEWKQKSQKLQSIVDCSLKWIDCNKIELTCNTHGIIYASYYSVKNSKGCPICHKKKIDDHKRTPFGAYTDILDALYGKKYTYDVSTYKGRAHPLGIECPVHGKFTASSVTAHIRGAECPKCSSSRGPRSKGEIEWLTTLGISEDNWHYYKKIDGKKYIFDAYDPDTNTIYEYWGDYYHGNPEIFDSDKINPTCKKTYGELYSATLERMNIITNAGYRLVSIWESEFNRIKNLTCCAHDNTGPEVLQPQGLMLVVGCRLVIRVG